MFTILEEWHNYVIKSTIQIQELVSQQVLHSLD